MVTKEILDSIIEAVVKEMNNLGTEKKRGGKTYTEYERQIYVMDTYIIRIANMCKNLIKQGNYSISRVTNHIRTFDWNRYSLSGKALSSDEVRKLLGENKRSTSVLELLSYQSYWLQKAGNHLADMIEGEMERKELERIEKERKEKEKNVTSDNVV